MDKIMPYFLTWVDFIVFYRIQYPKINFEENLGLEYILSIFLISEIAAAILFIYILIKKKWSV